MKTKVLFLFILLYASNILLSQSAITSTLESIPTVDNDELNSPVGKPGFLWACAATIKMPDFEERNNITYLESLPGQGILVATEAGDIWCLSPDDLSVNWKNKLFSEHVVQIHPSPTGSTFAVSYTSAKANEKSVEIRSGADGSLLHSILRITPYKCGYNAEYLKDVPQQTTLEAWEIAYSPDGSKIAVWYNNHGPNIDCQAIELEEIVIINTSSGAVEAVREGFIWDIWKENGVKKEIACGDYFPMTFDQTGQYLYVADCSSTILKYNATNLKLVKSISFFNQIEKIITVDLGIELLRNRFPLDEIYCQADGSLLVSYGGQGVGYVFRVSPDFSDVELITTNQGSEYASISLSPNGSMAMVNSSAVNLYDLQQKKPVFYRQTAGFAAEVARFHPTKQAILYGWDNFIKVIAKVPISEIYIGEDFTPTGHYINPHNVLAIRGQGKILWAFDDYDIYHLYAKDNELVTSGWLATGLSPAYDNENTIKQPAELKVKSTEPGNFTIFGGSLSPKTQIEVLQALPEWN
jgi:WD40 repeat protein